MNKEIWSKTIECVIQYYVRRGIEHFELVSDKKGIQFINLAVEYTADQNVIRFVIIRPFTSKSKGMNVCYTLTPQTRNAWENQAVKWLQNHPTNNETTVTFDVIDAVFTQENQVMLRHHHNVQQQLNPDKEEEYE